MISPIKRHAHNVWRILLLPVLLATTGCSPLRVVNGLSPSDHYERTVDIAYGDNARQALDVYTPMAAAGNSPVIVFFYGGGWRDGTKADYEFVASSLTDAGYVVVVPDYRLYPEVVFPQFVDDGAAAITWALASIGDYGGDTEKVFLMGHSAGAHIAALLVTNPGYLAAHNSDAARIRGFIGLSGPYDFLPIESGYLVEVFPDEDRQASQPINFVTADAPPALLIHGGDDDVVDAGNSERLAERWSDAGVPVTLRVYDGVGHARVAAELAPPLEFTGDTLEDVVEFVNGVGAER